MADANDCKLTVRSILVSSPVQITAFELNKQYREIEGRDIPYRELGHRSLDTYLHSLTDTLQIFGNGGSAEIRVLLSEKSAHVSALISKQKRPLRKRIRVRSRNYVFRPPPMRRPMYSTYEINKFEAANESKYDPYDEDEGFNTSPDRSHQDNSDYDLYKNQSQRVNNLNTSKPLTAINNQSANISYNTTNQNKTSPNNRYRNRNSSEHNETYRNNFRKSPVFNNSNSFRTSSPKKNRENTQNRKSSPDGVSAAGNSKTSEEIDCADDIFYSNPEEGGVIDCRTSVCYRVPHAIQANLKELLLEYPDGISCAKIPLIYNERFKKELRYNQFGYKSLIQMFVDLHSIVHYKQANKGDFIIFSNEHPVPDDFDRRYTQAVINPNIKIDGNLKCLPDLVYRNVVLNYPPNVVKLDDKLPKEVCYTNIGEYIEIQIGEIYDPSKFWFILKQNAEALDKMMDNMQDFYNREADKYKVPQTMLLNGLYCVVHIYNEYHRAVICNQMPDKVEKVKIFCLDYGTVSAMHYDCIWYLHKDFTQLPLQAIRARLTRLLPVNKDSQWTRDSARRFRQLVLDKNLVAMIDNYLESDKIFELFVTDTNTPVDIHIVDTLVHEGLAIYSHQEQLVLSADLVIPIHENIHLYPTFDEIEGGLVPSAFELNNIEIFMPNFHHHLTFPQYYKPAVSILPEANYEVLKFESFEKRQSHPFKENNETNESESPAAINDEGNVSEIEPAEEVEEIVPADKTIEVEEIVHESAPSPINKEPKNVIVQNVFNMPPPPPGFRHINPNNFFWSQSVNQQVINNNAFQEMLFQQQRQNLINQYLMTPITFPPYMFSPPPIMITPTPLIVPPAPIIIPQFNQPYCVHTNNQTSPQRSRTMSPQSSLNGTSRHNETMSTILNSSSPQLNSMSGQSYKNESANWNSSSLRSNNTSCKSYEVTSDSMISNSSSPQTTILNSSSPQLNNASLKSNGKKADSVSILTEEINNLNLTRTLQKIKRRFIIFIEHYQLHCILYRDKPYVMVNEVKKNYLNEDISIVQMRRKLACQFIMLNNINLKSNELLFKELVRLQLIESTVKTLDLVLLESLPDLLQIITGKQWTMPHFDEILKKMDFKSEEWIL